MQRSGNLSAINIKRPHREWKAEKFFSTWANHITVFSKQHLEGTAIPTELCRTEVLPQLMAGKSDSRASTVPRKVMSTPTADNRGAPTPHSRQIYTNSQQQSENHHPESCEQQQGKAGSPRAARGTAPFLLQSLPAPDLAAAERCWPQGSRAGHHLPSLGGMSQLPQVSFGFVSSKLVQQFWMVHWFQCCEIHTPTVRWH